MRLDSNWKLILRKAWSIRLILIAGILSGIEVVLPFFVDVLPRGTFAVLSMIAVTAAFIARIVAQKDVP